MIDHNEKGQFQKGNPGGPGRPPKAREAARLQVLREVVTQEKWRAICEKCVSDALEDEDGRTRDRARRFIAEYLVGKPAQTVRIRSEDAGPDEYVDLSDDDLRAIIAAEAGSRNGTEGAG